MSYLVLARKWRPQTFADMVGQEHVSQTLGNAIQAGRVHHAFLFTGARGVGKTSAARIFAKALNCEAGLSATPCNTCPSCVGITAGQNLDVFEIDGASNTGVDDVRELRENIRYLPSKSRFKIFIIDEVHMLSINAFNALLKTLEEPPDHAKFIFATTEPHKIPVTILSRCQRFDFRKIALPRVVARLQEIVEAENIRMSQSALSLVARRGDGSMRDSLSTLDQVIAFCGDEVRDEDVQGLLGMVDRRLLLETAQGVLGREPGRALAAVRRVDDLGHSFRQFGQELVDVFRSLVLCAAMDDPSELLQTTVEELEELRVLAAMAGLEDLQRALAVLMKAETELAGASFPRLTLEMALVRIATLPPARDVAAMVRKLEGLERRLAASGGWPQGSPPSRPRSNEPAVAAAPALAATVEPAPKKPEAPAAAAAAAGSRGWAGLVEFVRQKRRPVIASLLEHGSLLALELPLLEIGFAPGSFHLEQLRDADNHAALSEMAREYFGQVVNLKVSAVAADKADAPRSLLAERQAEESDRKRRLKDDALAHPMVQAVKEIFASEVVEVRPIDKGFV